MTTTTIATAKPAELGTVLPTITVTQAEAVRAAADAAIAAATRRAYRSTWRTWEAWCTEQGHAALPAHPLALAAWVTERAGSGRSMATVSRDLAAIRWVHEDAGHDDPTSARDLRLVMRGLRRQYGAAPRHQAHPLITDEVRRVVNCIDRTTLRGKRDAALILVGYAAALRRSEVADLNVGDLAFAARGVVVTVRRSKTDQEGEGRVVGVARGQNRDTDPVRAVREYVKAAEIDRDEPLFQRIGRGANHVMGRHLSGQSIATILRERAHAAGLDDLSVSGHSLRAGHATQAAEAGVAATRIARTTRHARLETLARYTRPAEVLQDTSSSELDL